MHLNNQQNVGLTLFLAMCLRVMPIPVPFNAMNPDWVLLILIYWLLMLPYRTGIIHAWSVGVLTDVLLGRSLGEYALIYTLVAYSCIALHRQLRQFPVIQQSVFIFVCLFFAQMLNFLIENIQSATPFSSVFWMPVLVGTVCWSAILPAMRFLRSFGRPH